MLDQLHHPNGCRAGEVYGLRFLELVPLLLLLRLLVVALLLGCDSLLLLQSSILLRSATVNWPWYRYAAATTFNFRQNAMVARTKDASTRNTQHIIRYTVTAGKLLFNGYG